MFKRLIVLVVLGWALWSLGSCAVNTFKAVSLHDGQKVVVSENAIVCRTIDPSGEWHDCRKVDGGMATLTAHPDFGLQLSGRFRAVSSNWGTGWLQLEAINP